VSDILGVISKDRVPTFFILIYNPNPK